MSGKLSRKDDRMVVGKSLRAKGTVPGKELRPESNQNLPGFSLFHTQLCQYLRQLQGEQRVKRVWRTPKNKVDVAFLPQKFLHFISQLLDWRWVVSTHLGCVVGECLKRHSSGSKCSDLSGTAGP